MTINVKYRGVIFCTKILPTRRENRVERTFLSTLSYIYFFLLRC